MHVLPEHAVELVSAGFGTAFPPEDAMPTCPVAVPLQEL